MVCKLPSHKRSHRLWKLRELQSRGDYRALPLLTVVYCPADCKPILTSESESKSKALTTLHISSSALQIKIFHKSSAKRTKEGRTHSSECGSSCKAKYNFNAHTLRRSYLLSAIRQPRKSKLHAIQTT